MECRMPPLVQKIKEKKNGKKEKRRKEIKILDTITRMYTILSPLRASKTIWHNFCPVQRRIVMTLTKHALGLRWGHCSHGNNRLSPVLTQGDGCAALCTSVVLLVQANLRADIQLILWLVADLWPHTGLVDQVHALAVAPVVTALGGAKRSVQSKSKWTLLSNGCLNLQLAHVCNDGKPLRRPVQNKFRLLSNHLIKLQLAHVILVVSH